MKRNLIRLLQLLLCAMMLGCSFEHTVAGRPGGDQTENRLTAQVFDSGGKPAASARVLVCPLHSDSVAWSSDSTPSLTLETRTDTMGRIFLATPTPGPYRIEVRSQDQALSFDVNLKEGDNLDAGKQTLHATGSLEGWTQPGALVALAGLRHWTRADSSGHFTLDSLPAGVLAVASQGGAQAWASVNPGAQGNAGQLRTPVAGEILLEDFEDGDSRHRYAPLVGQGWWYASASPLVRVSPDSLGHHPAYGILYDSLGGSKVYHAAFAFDTTEVTPWAEIGVGLTSRTAPADLSKLTMISFRARGSGSINLIFSSPGMQRLSHVFTLPQAWTEIQIPVDSLMLRGLLQPDSLGTHLQAISGIAWQCTGNAEIWLDEIRLIGLDAQTAWSHDITP